jgi:hypothetical protein
MVKVATVLKAVGPLRMIFWGALLLALHLDIERDFGGVRLSFGFLRETVGTVLIAIAAIWLARLSLPRACRIAIAFVAAVASTAVIAKVGGALGFHAPAEATLQPLLRLAELTSAVALLWSLWRIARAAGLQRSARSWRTTALLFAILFVFPLGVFFVASLGFILGLATLSRWNRFEYQADAPGWVIWAALASFAIMMTPVVHFFISTSRMIREARAAVPECAPRGGLPIHCPRCGRTCDLTRENFCPVCGYGVAAPPVASESGVRRLIG